MLIGRYQCSDSGKVFSHLPEKGPRPDVPQLQGFVSEHHHKVLSEDEHDKDTLSHHKNKLLLIDEDSLCRIVRNDINQSYTQNQEQLFFINNWLKNRHWLIIHGRRKGIKTISAHTAKYVKVVKLFLLQSLCPLRVKDTVQQAGPRSSRATHNITKKCFRKHCSGNTPVLDKSSGCFS